MRQNLASASNSDGKKVRRSKVRDIKTDETRKQIFPSKSPCLITLKAKKGPAKNHHAIAEAKMQFTSFTPVDYRIDVSL
jgi:hypothetical protein